MGFVNETREGSFQFLLSVSVRKIEPREKAEQNQLNSTRSSLSFSFITHTTFFTLLGGAGAHG